MKKTVYIWFICIVLSISCLGCAIFSTHSLSRKFLPDNFLKCQQSLVKFDKTVQSAGVADTKDTRICGFPYLRVNRFLASFQQELTDQKKISEWFWRVGRLGDQGRSAELADLPESKFIKDYPHTDKNALSKKLNQCAAHITDYASSNPDMAEALIKSASVDDDYSAVKRAIGLYPISRWFILSGLKSLHKESRDRFQNLTGIDKIKGNWYFPEPERPDLPPDKRREILNKAKASSALGIPEPDEKDLNRLFDYFSPIWHVMDYPKDNRIGIPYWKAQSQISVDTSDHVVYRYVSFTRIKNDILLQLNYVVWFSARPSTGFFDIYSGNIDGLIWRVTLSADGRVLLYDSVHCCGCYHKYFPVSSDLKPLKHPPMPESPLILDKDIPDNENSRVIIHLSGREHFVIGLTPVFAGIEKVNMYRIEPYHQLLCLPYQKGHKNMFGEDNIVKGSERKERWLVWPSGVLSPGAMRERGHHALALVGRQHFDDARLFEEVFDFR